MIKPLICSLLLVCLLTISQLHAQPARPAPADGAAAAAPPAPTTQALQAMIDDKQYQQVLKESQRMLALKGAAAKEIDKTDVLLLRAEAYLQLKQQAPAVEAYKSAVKEATDPTKTGVPKAMIALIQKSKLFMYTPKPSNDPTKPASPLNILDPVERKTALASLFEDEWKPTQAKIDQLKKKGATQLPPILEAAALAGEMRGLELAATGTDAKTSTALSDLTDSAAKLMNGYIDQKTKEVTTIDQMANAPMNNNSTDQRRMGLTAIQTNDLKAIMSDSQKLSLAAQQVANSAGAKETDFRLIADKADTLNKRATEVYNADYSQRLEYPNHPVVTTPYGTTPNGTRVQPGGYRKN